MSGRNRPPLYRNRRNAQTLLPDFRCGRIISPVGRPADVALMGAHDGPKEPPAVMEHGHQRGHVRQVAATMVRVVQEDHVALLRLGKSLLGGFQRPRQSADMDRDVIGLGNQTAAIVANGDREIAARVQDLGIGGAQHRLAHLGGNRAQPVPDHGLRDRVEGTLDEGCRRSGLGLLNAHSGEAFGRCLPPGGLPVRARYETARERASIAVVGNRGSGRLGAFILHNDAMRAIGMSHGPASFHPGADRADDRGG